MTTVAMRVDASRRIGLGHVKRCLALAHALGERGASVLVLARRSDVDVAALVQGQAVELLTLAGPACTDAGVRHADWLPVTPGQDAADTLAALQGRAAQVVLVDHYALDARWHRAIRAATGAAMVAIDDLADRPLAVDLLVDHNPAHDHALKYRAVLQDPARVCTGPQHALLDAAYAAQAPRRWSDEVQRIGIFMGGTDPGRHTLLAWQACRQHAAWAGTIDIATSSAHPNLAELHAMCAHDARLSLWVDQPNLASFHASHDLQVGAGGGALWERCALGVPTLALITAANQRLSVPLLAESGVVAGFDAVNPGPGTAAELGAVLARLIRSPLERAGMRRRSLALVDGQGARRVAAAMLALVTPPTQEPPP